MTAYVPSPRVAVCLALPLLLAADRVRADVVYSYTDATHYSYRVDGLPDFDQRRSDDLEPDVPGLPGDGGMYCLPTSFVNVMAYVASRGFLDLSPIPGAVPLSWQSQAVYDEVNDGLLEAGALMGTHPTDGTNGYGWEQGVHAWLERDPRLVLDNLYAYENWAPTERALHEVGRLGGLVCFTYGRYVVDGEGPGSITAGARVGGHMVTLRRVARNGVAFVLESRDPADSTDSMFEQSIFSNHVYNEARPVTVRPSGTTFERTMLQLTAVADDRVRLVDHVGILRPRVFISWDPTGDLFGVTIPTPLDPEVPAFQEFDPQTSSLTPLDDLVMAPDWGGAYFTTRSLFTGGTGRLAHVDFATGARTNLLTIDADGAHLVLGRGRELYLVDDQLVRCFDLTEDGVVLRSQVTLPAAIAAVAFDDAADQLVLLSLAARNEYRFAAWLAGGSTVRALPAGIPVGADGSVRVEPASGRTWVHVAGTDTLHGIIVNPAGPPLESFTHPSIAGLTSFDFDDHGRLFVRAGGVLHEFERGLGGTGPWQPAAISPSGLDGAASRSRIAMLRGRSNRRAEHEGPGWNNIEPAQLYPAGIVVRDCVADVDGDGTVAIGDLLAMLGAWGNCPFGCTADVDGSGAVDVGDLLVLLSSWGPCPE